uniref:CCHC-type domain-containing protein n=1 Tax=Cannabis sativa TaxID=3483 RepID=A0A803QQP1_CANSA
MDSFLYDVSTALSERERDVVTINGISAPPIGVTKVRVLCRIYSKRGFNPNQFKNFILKQWLGRFAVTISDYDSESFMVTFGCEGDMRRVLSKESWHFHNQHLILCPPTALLSDLISSYTITPFWVQVYRLPFLSKSEALAKIIGNLIGDFLEVHDDSLNEGWGPFLRIRVGIDVFKPLLHGQMISLPWLRDELWIEYRYERLLDFCYECGIIGHVFDKCSLFLEKLDDGIDPALEYGPCMEGSALPRSSYDRYRQDFSKSGPWPFITRLARNTINPIITHPTQPPALPRSATDQEKCLPSNGSPASLHQQLPTSNTTLVASASVTQLQHQRMPTLNAAIATSGSPHAKKLSTADSRANLDVPGANCTIDFKGKAIDRSKEFPPGYLPQKAIIVPVATPPAYIHCNSAATSLDANLTNAAKLPSTFTKRQMVNQGGNISPRALRQLRLLISKHLPDVLFIMESKLNIGAISKFRTKFNFSNALEVPRVGLNGSLLLLWKADVNVNFLNYGINFIDCYVSTTDGPVFHFLGFYGAPATSQRPFTWQILKRLKDTAPLMPLLVIPGTIIVLMALMSKRGLTMLLSIILGSLTLVRMSVAGGTHRQYKSQFHFEKIWLNEEEALDIINKHWTNASSDPLLQIKNNLSSCSSHLQSWHRTKFGGLPKKIHSTQHEVSTLQNSNLTTFDHFEELKHCEYILDELLAQEEDYWKQRSRINWLKSGDSNTKFFHQKANSQKKNNSIKKLMDDHGVEHTSQAAIANVVQSYFRNIYTTDGVDNEALQSVFSKVPCTITESDNRAITQPFTAADIYEALKSMNSDGSLGIDGMFVMFVMFYTNYWGIVGDLVTRSVLKVLNEGGDPTSFNQTLITLIPKVKKPINMTQLRPISLCFTYFKPLLFKGDDRTITVSDLLTDDNRWDIPLLQSLFLASDVEKILSIPLSPFHRTNHLIWHHEMDGCYTVKLGYKMALSLEEQQPNTSTSPAISWWKKFWSLSIPSKETIIHALFRCTRPKKFWKASHFSIASLLSSHAGLQEIMIKASTIHTQLELEQFACILWSLWTERNKERHDQKLISQQQVPAQQQLVAGPSQPPQKWLNPPSGRMKLNTNAAVDKAKQITGFGAILRNSSGECIAAMSRPFSEEVIIKVEGRGEFRCPKMIECNSVCQGYPNCCVNGQCLCEPCRTLLPQPLESSSPPEN